MSDSRIFAEPPVPDRVLKVSKDSIRLKMDKAKKLLTVENKKIYEIG